MKRKEKAIPKKSGKSLVRVLGWGCGAAASLLTAELVILLNIDRSKIEFRKNEDLFIECFTEWTEVFPEAIVTHSDLFAGRQLEVKKISGTVDTTKVGDYTLKYSAKFGRNVVETTRIVHVVDTTPPTITLKNDEGYFVTDFNAYEEEGFVATDNHDGDISSQVQVSHCGETILYTVADASGNETSIVRPIPYKDVEPPALTLNGNAHMYLQQGEEWVDPGCFAVDNYDIELPEVVVTSTLDNTQLGDYTITYSVCDASGNETSIERVVTVIDKNADNMIYLTFDDGPSPYTMDLLDILDKYQVKATFFVVGNEMSDVITEIANRGHTIGAHTYSHKYNIYKNEPTYYKDLNKILDLIENKAGFRPKLIRFPGGSSNTISANYCRNIMTQLAESVERHGYSYFDWSVNSGDAENAKTKDAVVQNVIAGIKETRRPVVLQHDTKDYSVAATEEIIKWALDHGYIFGVLDPDIECQHRILN